MPSSRLQEYIRAGKFSPAVAAQLTQVMNSDGALPVALSPTAPPSDLYVLDTAGNTATGCVLAILVMGAIAISVSFVGFTDGYLMGVAGLIFVFVLLAVVTVGSLNQAPPKPRPPKPVKAAKPAKNKSGKNKPAKPDAKADLPALAEQQAQPAP
jgi:hypothetical protein